MRFGKGRKGRKGKKVQKFGSRERKHEHKQKRERETRKKRKKTRAKAFLLLLSVLRRKKSNLSRGVSLSRVVTLKRVLIPSSTTKTRTIIPLLPERRFRRCPTRIKTILILIKTRSICLGAIENAFPNNERFTIHDLHAIVPEFPVALVGYDERCLFALQRWTRWWKQQQRQQQKRRR